MRKTVFGVRNMKKTTVFRAGADGYSTYRIPALIALPDGELLAFTEARSDDDDWAAMSLQMRRRSADGVWGKPVDVVQNSSGPAHNPVPFWADNKLHLIYGLDYKRFFIISSEDGGCTFGPAREITYVFEQMRDQLNWRAIACGPGGAVVMENGRIVVPVWLGLGTDPNGHSPCRTGSICSDDGGRTWQPGVLVEPVLFNTSEAQIAPVEGGLIMSLRNGEPSRRRGFAYSRDGLNWTRPELAESVREVCCQGSILRLPADGRLAITGPEPLDAEKILPRPPRERLTLQVSLDDGRSWQMIGVIEEGPSGYSALAADGDMLYCLYERWADSRYMDLVLAEIPYKLPKQH